MRKKYSLKRKHSACSPKKTKKKKKREREGGGEGESGRD